MRIFKSLIIYKYIRWIKDIKKQIYAKKISTKQEQEILKKWEIPTEHGNIGT